MPLVRAAPGSVFAQTKTMKDQGRSGPARVRRKAENTFDGPCHKRAPGCKSYCTRGLFIYVSLFMFLILFVIELYY